MEDFLTGSGQLEYRIASDDAYGLIERVLSAQQYGKLSKVEKGTLSRFLRKITGLSRAQINRLNGAVIRKHIGYGAIPAEQGQAHAARLPS